MRCFVNHACPKAGRPVLQPSPLLIGVQDIVAGSMSAYFGVDFGLTPQRIA